MTSSRLLMLAPGDDIAVALDDLAPGERVDSPAGQQPLTVRGRVPRGHKIALREVAAGAPVRKYGQIIGIAAVPISAGEHVHTQNLEFAPGMQGGAAQASGAALGFDRLVMLATGAEHIEQVLWTPVAEIGP